MNLKELLEKSYYGKDNSNYKEDRTKIGERNKHLEQVSNHGSASSKKCQPVKGFKGDKHKEMADDWAQLPGGGWRPMCRSCHSKYDGKHNNFK